ncbi:MAG: hypothetical protein IPL65_01875 [Lewinellaceae bacterium]|nr:hypothetical protein [Lewinellaceae bacterium]
MKKLLLLLLAGIFLFSFRPTPEWGFFGHRRINRLAVFTLPPGMLVFFKQNIDWLSDHAPDPDMRRYATSWEAPRHYIDLDNYGKPPYPDLPRRFSEAMMHYTDIYGLTVNGDTVHLFGPKQNLDDTSAYRIFFKAQVLSHYYNDDNSINPDSLNAFLSAPGRFSSAFFKENLSAHGILPWNLSRMQGQLTAAFRRRDSKKILRLCADMGHYIADAHVPLHTTSNYNGQKTGQDGIHGFWESRIPELFADEQYDYFVGKAEYIDRPDEFYWQTVMESNQLVDSVLNIEMLLRNTFPTDQQMCPDMRNGRVVVAPCRDFSKAYQEAMQGMVERRMRASIHAVASIWYTAWVDAGQPNLSDMDPPVAGKEELDAEKQLRQLYEQGKIIGREEQH